MPRQAAGILATLRAQGAALWPRIGPGTRRRPRIPRGSTAIALALQGGGSHGAFTWGVLDRLLEDQRLSITAISGASAGALNGAVLISGVLTGGRDGGRRALAGFWQGVSEMGRLSPLNSPLLSWTPGGMGLQALARAASPYQLNPLDLNPLRALLEQHVDFDRLRRNRTIRLLVSATNVHTGSSRLFRTGELSSEVLIASACLPHIAQAVEIDGAHYWDGGFTANPPVLPLIDQGAAKDILLVHIDTQGHPELPKTKSEISKRLDGILINAPLLREIQIFDELAALAGRGSALGRRLRALALHHILPPATMRRYESASKLDTDWRFLTKLRDIGWAVADVWLEENYKRLGTGSAVSLESNLMSPSPRLDAAEASWS